MKVKLSNVHKIGRYHNEETDQTVNIHTGNKYNGFPMYFYIKSGVRIWIAECDVYNVDKWKRITA